MWTNTSVSFITSDDIVRYPFIKEASDYFKAHSITIKDLETSIGRKILERAYKKIEEAIKYGKTTVDLSEDPEIEILSFPVALLLLTLLGDKSLVYKFAVAESKRVGELLKLESLEKLYHIAKETFGWKIELCNEEINGIKYDVKLFFVDYIQNIPQSSKEWKLVNRFLVKGMVYLHKSELARLIEEAVKNFIIKKCETTEIYVPNLPTIVAEYLEKLSREWSSNREYLRRTVKIDEKQVKGIYPPCIQKLIDDLKSGKNLPHAARFALATFLLNIGKSVEEVLDLFRYSPDFNEKIARYQIEHLAGLRGSRIKYVPYKCANMRSLGLCVDPEGKICGKINHPLQYYYRAIRRLMKSETKGKEKS